MKGEFENRLRQVIDEVQASPKPIILFIDEAHTLIGAGGAAGTGDAANLLKPALARGTLRTIAATTWAEYKKYIEKDPALTRRFQVVQVAEPSEEKAILMMRGVASTLEKHHRVQVLDEALEAAVRLSHRYIPARQLPDKAVSLLDTRARASRSASTPCRPQLEDCRRTIEALQTELEIIGREEAVGVDAGERAQVGRGEAGGRRDAPRPSSKQRWQAEHELVDQHPRASRASCAPGSEPVEGTGSKLEAAAEAQTGRATPPAAAAADARRARGAARRAGRAADEAGGAAGRVAADPAERRRAGGRLGRAGLDRHAGRPHGEERDRDGAQAGRDARTSASSASATRSR